MTPDRDLTRDRIVAAATQLLADGGPDAVTTRSVSAAAGVQPPTIYRLFGDKDGLLEAVADTVFAEYVDAKQVDPDADPVQDLRAGFTAHVDFNVANPGLTAIFANPLRARSATEERGIAVLRERIRRVARAGRLKVPEERALGIVRVIGLGLSSVTLEMPVEQRDSGLADAAWAALAAAVLTDTPVSQDDDARTAALRLRADDDALAPLSPAERALLKEWLDRIAADAR